MGSFVAGTQTFRGGLLASAAIDDVFPLFSPEGEKLWVPEWAPEPLHPPGTGWEEGQIFRTREESGEAVWIITRLDRGRHRVAYHRVEPGWYVAHIAVACRPIEEQRTEISTTYTFVGLSEAGNRAIDAMTQEAYDAKMSRWSEWIGRYLASKAKGPAA